MVYRIRIEGMAMDGDFMTWLMVKLMPYIVFQIKEGMIWSMAQADRQRVERIIGHPPSQEDLEYFWAMEHEAGARWRGEQSEHDREKIRNYFGEQDMLQR